MLHREDTLPADWRVDLKNKMLIKLRIDHDLTQADMACLCGVSVGTYNMVENGSRRGSKELWRVIQAEFSLTGEQMWLLQNPDINE